MKSLLVSTLLLVASYANAEPVTVIGRYEIKAFSSSCTSEDSKLHVPLGEVKVPKAGGERNSAIISNCELFNALKSCESQSGVLTFENASTGDWSFPDTIVEFICQPQ
jgi:hypothetical protein